MNNESLVLLAVVIGGVVRLLRTQRADALAYRFFGDRVPRWALPWVALALGVVVSTADSLFGCAADGASFALGCGTTWQAALVAALKGVFAGAFAVAGHETVAKTTERMKQEPQ